MDLIDSDNSPRARDYVEMYVDGAGQHRWRYKAGNGEVLADGGEGYARIDDALRGIGIVTGRQPTIGETKDSIGLGAVGIRVVRIPDTKDRSPHSRACGIAPHDHGPACSTNCPTCNGRTGR